MGYCAYHNEEKSGPVNGWYCDIEGSFVDRDLYSNYCGAEVSCQYCPVRGGDDRIRNPDALTPERVQSIQQSFANVVECAIDIFCQCIQWAVEPANDTQYAPLVFGISEGLNQTMSTPCVSGVYTSVVMTDAEKERARSLEDNLSSILQSANVGGLVYYNVRGDMRYPNLNSSIFNEINGNLFQVIGMVSSALSEGVEVDSAVLAEIANLLLEQLADYIGYFIDGIIQKVYSAAIQFHRGERFLDGVGNNYSTYNGKMPEWN